MDSIFTSLEVLIQGLKKKKKCLDEILSYSMKQSELLQKEELDMQVFQNIITNKQYRIDEISTIDSGFEQIYNRVKTRLTQQPEIYKNEIGIMRSLIRENTERGVEIQRIESENHQSYAQVTKRMKTGVQGFRKSKKAVTGYYNNYNKQQDSVRNRFFDSKK